jgi:hypothetical protein
MVWNMPYNMHILPSSGLGVKQINRSGEVVKTQNKQIKTMKLINVTGTSDKTCNCDSWLDHWETFSGQKATVCGVNGCSKSDVVGAHVRKYGESTQ